MNELLEIIEDLKRHMPADIEKVVKSLNECVGNVVCQMAYIASYRLFAMCDPAVEAFQRKQIGIMVRAVNEIKANLGLSDVVLDYGDY